MLRTLTVEGALINGGRSMVEQPKPQRRGFTVYLTDDERECLAAAAPHGKLGPFIRRVALFRVGWQRYCGVLFEDAVKPAPAPRDAGAEAFYMALAAAVELATDAAATYRAGLKPSAPVLRMMLNYAGMLVTFADFADDMKRLDGVVNLAFALDDLGDELGPHTLAAGKLREAAGVIIEALQKGDHDGRQEQTQA